MKVLRSLVPEAVAQAREQVKVVREPLLDGLRRRARKEQRRLLEWEQKSLAAIAADERRARKGRSSLPPLAAKRLQQRRDNVARFRRNHELWLKSLSAHGAPYVRLAAVFTGK
jgi:hypothetical protein